VILSSINKVIIHTGTWLATLVLNINYALAIRYIWPNRCLLSRLIRLATWKLYKNICERYPLDLKK